MKERLEDFVRPEETSAKLVLLLRGGVHAEHVDRLQDQAGQLNRRFSFEGGGCYGISVFAATEQSEPWVLARHMGVRRRYYRVRYPEIAQLRILPTFRSPHWTVLFSGPEGPDYSYFVDALGELRDNPYYRHGSGRSRR